MESGSSGGDFGGLRRGAESDEGADFRGRVSLGDVLDDHG